MKAEFSWVYNNTWRPTASLLWCISAAFWMIGLVLEFWLPGAFAASGGLTIAATTPLFGLALAKQNTYELDMKLGAINQRQQANLGLGVIENMAENSKALVGSEIKNSTSTAEQLEGQLKIHENFSRSLLLAQSLIVSGSSVIWSTGIWFGNFVVHCGKVQC